MLDANSNYSTDYVYSPFENNTFKNVHIDLKIETDKWTLIITSKDEIVNIDLENILKSLQEDKFSKLKCSIYEDCRVFLKVINKIYKVHLNDELKISNLELTEA